MPLLKERRSCVRNRNAGFSAGLKPVARRRRLSDETAHDDERNPILSNTSDPLLTRREVAERWRQSTETVKRRERAGVLHALKLGRGVRYRLSDVLAFESAAEIGARITAQ